MYESLAESQDSCSLAIYYKPSSSNNYIEEAQILTFFTDGHGQINGQPALEGSEMTTGNVVEQALKYAAIPGTATDTEVMQANLQAMTDIIPAESYGLIFGSHATSWMPAAPSRSGKTVPYTTLSISPSLPMYWNRLSPATSTFCYSMPV